MARLKGLRKIDRIINNFVKQFDLTAELDTDFGCFIEDRSIGYPLVLVSAADEYYVPFVNELDPVMDGVDVYITSLFHEIGHIYTRNDFTDDEWEDDLDEKDEIEYAMAVTGNDEDMKKDLHLDYFNLPCEKAATLWGIEYIKNHEAEVAAFWDELRAAIMEFYKKNGVID